MSAIPTGRYRHYKGKEYTVVGVARHSETQEELVVYRQEYGDYSLWVRPKAMFLESGPGEEQERTGWRYGDGPPRPSAFGRDHERDPRERLHADGDDASRCDQH